MDIKRVIKFLGHAGFIIEGEKRIAIDPYNISAGIEPVDIILITHSHYDHCSIEDIKKIAKKGTMVVLTADTQSKITKIENVDMQIVEPGDKIDFNSIKIEAVPAYNKNKKFHPKKEGWVGYVIKMDKLIIYHAGDTDKIPEMQKLTGHGKHENTFVALLPVSGKYVMNSREAAEAAEIIRPDIAIPMHYGSGVAGTVEDAQNFVKLCSEKNIKAEILPKV